MGSVKFRKTNATSSNLLIHSFIHSRHFSRLAVDFALGALDTKGDKKVSVLKAILVWCV